MTPRSLPAKIIYVATRLGIATSVVLGALRVLDLIDWPLLKILVPTLMAVGGSLAATILVAVAGLLLGLTRRL
jgi:hypothetical protein